MGTTTIEWANFSFNPWIGCTRVSPACDHCYAETWSKRYNTVEWGAGKPRKLTSESNWQQPIKWNREAEKSGERKRVFCASLADVFDNEVDPAWRIRLFALIEKTPHLDWLLLTKRIGNVPKMLPMDWGTGWPNVWLGISVVNQEEADRDIPKLLRISAHIRFLSMEPLLGPVDLRLPSGANGPAAFPHEFDLWTEQKRDKWFSMQARATYMAQCECIDWVIVGGESGADARPMHPDWATSLRDQCRMAGVAFHFKQWGEWAPEAGNGFTQWPEIDKKRPLLMPQHPGREGRDNHYVMQHVGKKVAGRLLDGRTWDGLPEKAA
jgi:protein gp37